MTQEMIQIRMLHERVEGYEASYRGYKAQGRRALEAITALKSILVEHGIPIPLSPAEIESLQAQVVHYDRSTLDKFLIFLGEKRGNAFPSPGFPGISWRSTLADVEAAFGVDHPYSEKFRSLIEGDPSQAIAAWMN